MKPQHAFALLLAGLAAGACTPVDVAFGETHRWNIEQQVVDPDPQYAGTEMEGGSGERAAAAVDRYNRGEVTEPARVNTTSTAGGGGSGSGASSSSGSGPR